MPSQHCLKSFLEANMKISWILDGLHYNDINNYLCRDDITYVNLFAFMMLYIYFCNLDSLVISLHTTAASYMDYNQYHAIISCFWFHFSDFMFLISVFLISVFPDFMFLNSVFPDFISFISVFIQAKMTLEGVFALFSLFWRGWVKLLLGMH